MQPTSLNEIISSGISKKMKVSLAAQILSRSVANAFEFASNDLRLQQFADVTATIEFIRVIDHLFDILNSKSIFAKEYKSVLCVSNDIFFRRFLIEAKDYLLQLRLGDLPMHETPRKTTVLGFVATIWDYTILT